MVVVLPVDRQEKQRPAAAYARVQQLESGSVRSRIVRGYTFLRWHGTADTLAAVMRDVGVEIDGAGNATWARVQAARVQRRWQDVLTALDASPLQSFSARTWHRPWSLLRAEAFGALGDAQRSRAEYEKARAALIDSLRSRPDDARLRVPLGIAYGGLGLRAEAIAEARRVLELAKLSRDNLAAAAAMSGAVEVFARAGAADAAFEQLDILFTMPAGREVSVALLRVDPTYDPLRADPRFEALIRRYSQ